MTVERTKYVIKSRNKKVKVVKWKIMEEVKFRYLGTYVTSNNDVMIEINRFA